MCKMCQINLNASCPHCGVWVCWDVRNGDDILRQAAATPGGDLACIDCAIQIAREEEAEWSDEGYLDFDPYDD